MPKLIPGMVALSPLATWNTGRKETRAEQARAKGRRYPLRYQWGTKMFPGSGVGQPYMCRAKEALWWSRYAEDDMLARRNATWNRGEESVRVG